MRIALAFRESDVDGFLENITADQYAWWQAFFALEPIGWPAMQMIVRRLVWSIFQRGRQKVVPELPFKTAAEAALTPEQQRIRAEIQSAKWDARAAADAQG